MASTNYLPSDTKNETQERALAHLFLLPSFSLDPILISLGSLDHHDLLLCRQKPSSGRVIREENQE